MAHPQAPEQQMQALSPADFALAAMFAPGLEPTRNWLLLAMHVAEDEGIEV
jgi:hypothetical protein